MASAAAAIVGARHGKELGEQLIRQQRAQRQSMIDSLRRQQKKMVDDIMQAYDQDGGGTLSKEELAPMLEDYSLQIFGSETKPTKEEVDFLFALCEKKGGGSNKSIGRGEVLAVCEAWGEFLKQKTHIRKLLSSCDANGDFAIDKEELQPLLDSLNGGTKVPPEVTSWVMKQSDITNTGILSEMELARAVYAFQRWNGTRTTAQADQDQIEVGIQEDANLPPPNKGCCILL